MNKQTKPRASLAFRNKLRASILEIGKRLIEEEGLSRVQARRIAVEAGCAVGSIYNVFEDLDELIINLNSCSLNELGAKLHADHDQPKQSTTHGRLLALATAYFLYATNHKMPWRAIFDHQLSEGRTAPPEYREDQDRLFALVEECLANDIAEKDQRKNAARALFASVNGIVSLSLDRKLGDFEPETTRRQIEFLIGCTAHGLHQASKEQC